MVLSMPSPYRHKSTGIYWFKQRVPARLAAMAKGKSVTVTVDGMPSMVKLGEYIKVSLRTKDGAEAKRLAKDTQGEFDLVWLTFEQGPVKLSLRQITALAGEMYHIIRAVLEDDPGQAAEWAQRRRDADASEAKRVASPHRGLMIAAPSLEARLGSWVDGALAEHHLKVDDDTRRRMLIEFDRAAGEIAMLLERRGGGDFGPDAVGSRFSLFVPDAAPVAPKPSGGLTLTHLVDVWASRLSTPKTQTVKGYRSIVTQFVAFLGHDAAEEVTDMDVARWHASLVGTGTIKHDTFIKKHRAAISTIYEYGMTPQGRMALADEGLPKPAINPAKVKLEGEKRVISRPLHFTTAEARSILRATLRAEQAGNGFADYNRAAQRWVPWICAYTGARAGEVAQLRKKDFAVIEGVQCVALLPDAGTIKTRKFRYVPLHPVLIEQGLWAFAQKAKAGPLFYNAELTSEQPWVQTVQMLGEWVRETAKVTDDRISPNHAWRHWFKSKGRTANIGDSYLDVICGQALPTAGRNYGEYEPPALLREIAKLPVLSLADDAADTDEEATL